MFTVPSLPTESLYKFATIGGIIMVITSTFYYLSESQKIGVDTIKLDTTRELYSLRYNKYLAKKEKIIKEFKEKQASLEKSLDKVKKEKRYMLTHKGIITVFIQNGIKYDIKKYETSLYKELDKSYNEFHGGLAKEDKSIEGVDLDEIKMLEQAKLIDANSDYLSFVLKEVIGVSVLGILCFIYGLFKWNESQLVSDEMGRIQLAKARKEFDDSQDKKKIIL